MKIEFSSKRREMLLFLTTNNVQTSNWIEVYSIIFHPEHMHCSLLKFWYWTHLSRKRIVKRAPSGGFKGFWTPIPFFSKCKWVFRCQWSRCCGWSILGALATTTARAAKTCLLKWIRVFSNLTLSRFSSTLLKMPNVGDFPCSSILGHLIQLQQKGKKNP